MLEQKISRNDPCPCGSGKKYKHCCIGKDTDWSARPGAVRRLLPPPVSKPSEFSFGQFGVVDAKLVSIARTHPGPWKSLVERLSDSTTDDDRMNTYLAVREAKAIPDEAGEFLISWAIQWMPIGGDLAPDDDDFDEEAAGRKFDEEMLAQLRRYGANDLAEMFVTNRLEFDRRHERGRQFFYGPPDQELARNLRAKGVID